MGSNFLGERFDIKTAKILVAGGGSSANSQAFSLQDVSRVTIICGLEAATAVALATAVAPCTVSVVVGTYTTAASGMTLLTGATLEMGQATLGVLTNWDVVGIGAEAAVATGRKLIIDGTTFMIEANATLADKQISASATPALVEALACVIATFCTHLETFGMATAGDATAESMIFVRRKDYGAGQPQSIDVQVTANASSSGQVFIQGIQQTGVIEFRPSDVLATNASYTHFAVRFNSAVTSQQFAAIVIRETGYQVKADNRTQL